MSDGRSPLHLPFRVGRMRPEQVPFVVEEHLRCFPDGFFARLGPRFLAAYCLTYLSSPYARAYTAEGDGGPVGFLVGVTDPPAHRSHVLHEHGRHLLLCAGTGMAVRPQLAGHFLRTRLARYCVKLTRPAPQARGPQGVTAVLSHVAVSEHARSGGVGAALIGRFVEDATAAGCARVQLVTAAGAAGAGAYYERRGWLPGGESRSPEGRRLATYDLPLPSSTALTSR